MIRILLVAAIAASCGQVNSEEYTHPMFEFLSNFNHLGFGTTFNNLLQQLSDGLNGNSNERSLSMGDSYNFTAWGGFGACSKVCGGGSRARSRACVNSTGHPAVIDKCFQRLPLGSYDLYKIIKYGSEKMEIDEELCNKHECDVSEWELDKSCSQKCGGGYMTYRRTCLSSGDQQKCNFQSTKLVSCNTAPCFRLGEWQEWSRCTAPCGNGHSSRKRTCEPNVPRFSPLYPELMYALEHVTTPAVLRTLTNENEVYYFTQYLASCGSHTVQTRICNVQHCPSCPKNQIYHTCMPCTRVCKPVDMTNLFNLEVNVPKIQMNPNGCGGICLPGCGCPPLTPLLGSDGGCYAIDLLCPVNHLTHAQKSQIILQMVANQNRERTTSAPELNRNLLTTSTAAPTTTDETTTTMPVTTGSTQSKAYCPKDIPIMEHDFCICSGVLQIVNCVAQPHQKCPVICKNAPVCPSKFSPRLKSTYECGHQECSANDECGEGKLCCELLCGKRCIDSE